MKREDMISEYKKAYDERQKILAKIDILQQQLAQANGVSEELRLWMAGLEAHFDKEFGRHSPKHSKTVRNSLGVYIRRGEEVPE